MEEAGLNMKSLSRRAGLNAGYVSEMLAKGVTPTVEVFLALAEAAGASPQWLLQGEDHATVKLPIIGVVTSAEAWTPTVDAKRNPFELDVRGYDMVAIEVRGDAMAPVYRDQDMLVCQRRSGKFLQNLVGLDCVVETTKGERYLKILQKGSRSNLYTLRSYSPAVKDVENVAIAWAAPVIWIRRGGR